MCLVVACELSNFLAFCLTLLAGNLLNSTCPSFKVFDTNDSSFKKNQKMSLWRICAVSGGYLASATYVCTALYHSSTLISACKQLVSRSNLALNSFAYGLQNSSIFFHITSRVRSSFGKFHEMYWSNPKSPDQAMTFLHFLDSGSMASSHSSMFSHLIFHFRNLLYKPSSTFQFILGPSI